MRRLLFFCFALILSLSFVTADIANAGRRVKLPGQSSSKGESNGDKSKPNGKKKSFSKLTKDKVKTEGFFTFYQDTTDNSVLMMIKPDQIGPVYLCGMSRTAAEGAYFDAGAMQGSFPFFFERVGNKLMMMEKNVRFRADTSSTLARAIPKGISDHLFAATKVLSNEDDSGAFLVNPADFFVRDINNIGYFLGKRAHTGLSFDKGNSYFTEIKSFPFNSELEVRAHFKTNNPLRAHTMQNSYSMFHTYHYSLSALPESDFTPRIADDRVGHFLTLYQDYSNLTDPDAYVRYVERWNLKKKNPDARVSDPVDPIVFYVDNTVPEEYRDAVAEGIEFWNYAFDELGFRNAIIARQMSDTADWDAADVRYNVVQWIINPGASYAVGPSHSNPYTGEIYDADVRVSVDFIRHMFMNAENFIGPVSQDGMLFEEDDPMKEMLEHNPRFCNYGTEAAKEAAFGLAYISSLGDFADKDKMTKEYIHAYIVELVAHEVGHTLGLRHNFKASTIYTLDQINDPSWTKQNGTVGSIMDYVPPNIAGKGKEQGEFYCSVPGPYDKWAIEYSYTDFGDLSTEEELPLLKEIADRSPEHNLIYATDEDAYGPSVDPTCTMFDLGADPIAYCEHKIGLTKELWTNAIKQFEEPGERYQKIRTVFGYGWRSYIESARLASKYIGGLYHSRHHIGDVNGKIPFTPVPAAEQRRAMQFLAKNIFAADAFEFSPDLLNKLQPERFPGFNYSFRSTQLDYPIHNIVLYVQNNAIWTLYNTRVLARLRDNQLRLKPGEEGYTMTDMFTDTRRAIWGEIVGPKNVNSWRRQLQMSHLTRLLGIFLGSAANYPYDARALAGNDLDIIEGAIKNGVNSSAINVVTKAHFKEVLRQINAAKGADREFLGSTF